jgi:hypothetical protein
VYDLRESPGLFKEFFWYFLGVTRKNSKTLKNLIKVVPVLN